MERIIPFLKTWSTLNCVLNYDRYKLNVISYTILLLPIDLVGFRPPNFLINKRGKHLTNSPENMSTPCTLHIE